MQATYDPSLADQDLWSPPCSSPQEGSIRGLEQSTTAPTDLGVVGAFGLIEVADVGGGDCRAAVCDVGAEKWSCHVVSVRAYDRRSVWWR
ncbi:hypothetical protein MTO96_011508 [Rhipicephalus appendiculatus]